MPLFWFNEGDVGVHGANKGASMALMSYLDDIGADDVADRIMAARTDEALMSAVVDGLEALQELTDSGLEWSVQGGQLILE